MGMVEFRKKYFAALLELMKEAEIPVSLGTPSGQQFQIIYRWPGPSDVAVNILPRKKEIRVDLTLKGKNADEEYRRLKKERKKIEEIIGRKLEWRPNRDSKPPHERQMIWRLHNTDPRKESDWPRQHAWLAARLVAFRLAFGPIIEGWQA